MTTVAAICLIPIAEEGSTVLEGPSLGRAMKTRHEKPHETEERHSESGYGHNRMLKWNIEHCKI